MATSVTVSVYLLLISNLLLICAVGLAIVRFLNRIEDIERFSKSPTRPPVSEQKPDDAQLQLGIRLEQRIDDLHRIVRIMAAKSSARRHEAQQAPPVAAVLPLDNALRMARQGATIEDLTRNCGLSVGEAKLMKKLHGSAQGVH